MTELPLKIGDKGPETTTPDPLASSLSSKLAEASILTSHLPKMGLSHVETDNRSTWTAALDGVGTAISSNLSGIAQMAGAKPKSDAEIADAMKNHISLTQSGDVVSGLIAGAAKTAAFIGTHPKEFLTGLRDSGSEFVHTLKSGSKNDKAEALGGAAVFVGSLLLPAAGGLSKIGTESEALGLAGRASTEVAGASSNISAYFESARTTTARVTSEAEARMAAAETNRLAGTLTHAAEHVAGGTSTAASTAAAESHLVQALEAPGSSLTTRLSGDALARAIAIPGENFSGEASLAKRLIPSAGHEPVIPAGSRPGLSLAHRLDGLKPPTPSTPAFIAESGTPRLSLPLSNAEPVRLPIKIEPVPQRFEPVRAEAPQPHVQPPQGRVEAPRARVEQPQPWLEPAQARIEPAQARIEPAHGQIHPPQAPLETPPTGVETPHARVEPARAQAEPPHVETQAEPHVQPKAATTGLDSRPPRVETPHLTNQAGPAELPRPQSVGASVPSPPERLAAVAEDVPPMRKAVSGNDAPVMPQPAGPAEVPVMSEPVGGSEVPVMSEPVGGSEVPVMSEPVGSNDVTAIHPHQPVAGDLTGAPGIGANSGRELAETLQPISDVPRPLPVTGRELAETLRSISEEPLPLPDVQPVRTFEPSELPPARRPAAELPSSETPSSELTGRDPLKAPGVPAEPGVPQALPQAPSELQNFQPAAVIPGETPPLPASRTPFADHAALERRLDAVQIEPQVVHPTLDSLVRTGNGIDTLTAAAAEKGLLTPELAKGLSALDGQLSTLARSEFPVMTEASRAALNENLALVEKAVVGSSREVLGTELAELKLAVENLSENSAGGTAVQPRLAPPDAALAPASESFVPTKTEAAPPVFARAATAPVVESPVVAPVADRAAAASQSLNDLSNIAGEKGLNLPLQAQESIRALDSQLQTIARAADAPISAAVRSEIADNFKIAEDALAGSAKDPMVGRQLEDLRASINKLAPSPTTPLVPVTEAPAVLATEASDQFKAFAQAVESRSLKLSPEAEQSLAKIDAHIETVARNGAAPVTAESSRQLAQDMAVVKESLVSKGADPELTRQFSALSTSVNDASVAVVERQYIGQLRTAITSLESQSTELSTGIRNLSEKLEPTAAMTAADKDIATIISAKLEALEPKLVQSAATEAPVTTAREISQVLRELDQPEYRNFFASNPEASAAFNEIKSTNAAITGSAARIEETEAGMGGLRRVEVFQQNADTMAGLSRDLQLRLPQTEAVQPVARALRNIESDLGAINSSGDSQSLLRSLNNSIEQIERAGAPEIAQALKPALKELEESGAAVTRSQSLEQNLVTLRTVSSDIESQAAKLSHDLADQTPAASAAPAPAAPAPLAAPDTTIAATPQSPLVEQLQVISREAPLIDAGQGGTASIAKIKDAFAKVEDMTASQSLTAEQESTLQGLKNSITRVEQASAETTALKTIEAKAVPVPESVGVPEAARPAQDIAPPTTAIQDTARPVAPAQDIAPTVAPVRDIPAASAPVRDLSPAATERVAVASQASDSIENLASATRERGVTLTPRAQSSLESLDAQIKTIAQTPEAPITAAVRNEIGNNFKMAEEALVGPGADPIINQQFEQLKVAINKLSPSETMPLVPVSESPALLATRAGENLETFTQSAAARGFKIAPEAEQSLERINTHIDSVLRDGEAAAPITAQSSEQLAQDVAVVEKSLVTSGADPVLTQQFGALKASLSDVSTAVVEREHIGAVQSSMNLLENQSTELSSTVRTLSEKLENSSAMNLADRHVASTIVDRLNGVEQKLGQGALTEAPVATSTEVSQLVTELERPEYGKFFVNNPEAAAAFEEVKASSAAVANTTSKIETAEVGIGGLRRAQMFQENVDNLASLSRELKTTMPAAEASQPVVSALTKIERDLTSIKSGANTEAVLRDVRTSMQAIENAGATDVAASLKPSLSKLEDTSTAIERSGRLEQSLTDLRSGSADLETQSSTLSQKFADEAATAPSTTSVLPVPSQVSDQLQLISRQAKLIDAGENGAAAITKIKDAFTKVEELTATSTLTSEQEATLMGIKNTIAKVDRASVEATGLQRFESNAAKITEQSERVEALTDRISQSVSPASGAARDLELDTRLNNIRQAAAEVKEAQTLDQQAAAVNKLNAAVQEPELQTVLKGNKAALGSLSEMQTGAAELHESVSYRALERSQVVASAEAENAATATRTIEARIENDAALATNPSVQNAAVEYRTAAESFAQAPDKNLVAADMERKLEALQTQISTVSPNNALLQGEEMAALRRAQAGVSQSTADSQLLTRSLIDRRLPTVEGSFDQLTQADSSTLQRAIMNDISEQIQRMRYLEGPAGDGADRLAQAQMQLLRAQNDMEVAAYRSNLVKLAAAGDRTATDKLLVSGLTSDGFKTSSMAVSAGPAARLVEEMAKHYTSLQGLYGKSSLLVRSLTANDPLFVNNAGALSSAMRYAPYALIGGGATSFAAGYFNKLRESNADSSANPLPQTSNASIANPGLAAANSASDARLASAPLSSSANAALVANPVASANPGYAGANPGYGGANPGYGGAAADGRVIGRTAGEPNGFSPNGQTMARSAYAQDLASQALPRATSLNATVSLTALDGTTGNADGSSNIALFRPSVAQAGPFTVYNNDVNRDAEIYRLQYSGTLFGLAKGSDAPAQAEIRAPFSMAQTLHIGHGGGKPLDSKLLEKPATTQFAISASTMYSPKILSQVGRSDVLSGRFGGAPFGGIAGGSRTNDTSGLRVSSLTEADGDEAGAGAGTGHLKHVERTESKGVDSGVAHAGAVSGTTGVANSGQDDEDNGVDPDPTTTAAGPNGTSPAGSSPVAGRRVPPVKVAVQAAGSAAAAAPVDGQSQPQVVAAVQNVDDNTKPVISAPPRKRQPQDAISA